MVAHEGHDMSSMGGMDMDSTSGHSSTSMGMGMGMNMFFFSSTTTPLYSEAWTPASPGAYAGTCIFLIILSILLRALFTAKTFLEYRALKTAMKRRYVVTADQPSATDKAFSDANSMTGILTTNGLQENVRIVEAPARHVQPFRFSLDLPRAAIMTVAAGVGYLLMLAVMTYNVGYFLSVLAGAFLGELALGRFNHGAMSM